MKTIKLLTVLFVIASAVYTRAADFTGTSVESTFQLTAIGGDPNLWDGNPTTTAVIGPVVEFSLGSVSADFGADSLSINLTAVAGWGSDATFTFSGFDGLSAVEIDFSDFVDVQILSSDASGFSVFIPTQFPNSSSVTSVQFSLAAIPEPSAAAALAGCGALIAAASRRRRR